MLLIGKIRNITAKTPVIPEQMLLIEEITLSAQSLRTTRKDTG